MVVLDDLHWVDSASLQLLRHLVASAISMSVLVVGTFRDSDLSRSHPLTGALADLRRDACVERLDLLGLEDTDIIDLLEVTSGQEVREDGVALAHALRRETDGNPFFLVEMIRHLADTGAFVQNDEGRWVLSDELDALRLPTSVREVVGHRVARLGEETEQALSLASVIGREFDLELLGRLLPMEEDRLLDVLDGAMRAGLVTESETDVDRYRFVHALIQHTLYQDMNASRRQRGHHRVAEALETGSADSAEQVAELARHWMAATRPADATKALYYARRAGDVALAAFAPLDAITWYSQALELLARQTTPHEQERCALLVGLGTAQRLADEPAYRQTLLDAAALAETLGDTGLLAGAALGVAWGRVRLQEEDAEQADVLQQALTAVGASDNALRARLLVALAEVTDARHWERQRDLAVEAVALARGVGDDATVLDVLTKSYGNRVQPESWAQRLAETEEAVILADRLGDVQARLQSRWNRMHACMEVAALDEYDSGQEELSTLVEQTGLPAWRSYPSGIRAGRRLLSGDLAGAEEAAQQFLAVGMKLNTPATLAGYGGHLYEIRLQQGRLAEIAGLFIQATEANPAIAALRAAVVDMYCELGRLDEARVLFEPDVAGAFLDIPRDPVWTTAMAHFSDSAVSLQHRDGAQLLYDQMRPFAELVVYPLGPILGAFARPIARLAHLLGNDADAESLFQSALSINQRLRAPYWIARTKLDYADLLRKRAASDVERAREIVGEALLVSEQYGYRGLVPRAQSLLSSLV